MKIPEFTKVLNDVINFFNSTEVPKNGKPNPSSKLKYFDTQVALATRYIQKLCEESGYADGDVPREELSEIIISDYKQIIDEIFVSNDIYCYLMNYIATIYLYNNPSELFKIAEEVKEKGMTYKDDQVYKDDFHHNLLLTYLDLEEFYKSYIKNVEEINGPFIDEMRVFARQYGPKEGFIKYCDVYCGKNSTIPVVSKRDFARISYYVIFGFEGLDRENLPKNDKALKYLEKFQIKNFMNMYVQDTESNCRNILVDSISAITQRLGEFGYFDEAQKRTEVRMKTMSLPGLKFNRKEEETTNNPSIERILSAENLEKLDIQELTRLHAFYNNKLAKMLESYEFALYYGENLGFLKNIAQGEIVTREDIDEEEFEQIYIKKLVIEKVMKKIFYFVDKTVQSNPLEFEKGEKSLKLKNNKDVKSTFTVIDMEVFAKQLEEKWGTEFETYFNEKIPNCNNNLDDEVVLQNYLYNGIFGSYVSKSLSMRAEYAYLIWEDKFNSKNNLNFGLCLEYDKKGNRIPVQNKNTILIASDGKSGRSILHVPGQEFIEFCKSMTESNLIRIYEGAEDFTFIGDIIPNHLLLPFTKAQISYLKEIKKKSSKTEGNLTEFNEAFVDHTLYTMGVTNFLKRYSEKDIKYDKKGNPIVSYIPTVRYLDVETNKLYLEKNGELIEIPETPHERTNFDET